jgi:hypothetical protein
LAERSFPTLQFSRCDGRAKTRGPRWAGPASYVSRSRPVKEAGRLFLEGVWLREEPVSGVCRVLRGRESTTPVAGETIPTAAQ